MPSAKPEPRQDPVLTYASGQHDSRTSKLAIVSLGAAIPFSPCLLMLLMDKIDQHLPTRFRSYGTYGDWHSWAFWGCMIITTALPVAAIARIYFSRGRRRGLSLAFVALGLWVGWWTLLYVIDQMLVGAKWGPGD